MGEIPCVAGTHIPSPQSWASIANGLTTEEIELLANRGDAGPRPPGWLATLDA